MTPGAGTVGPDSAREARRSLPYIPALDGIRGLAVAGVLLFHGGFLAGGFLGVDLFFVLSGYLITWLLLVEVDRSGSLGLASFWARRARRLLPALAGLLLGVALYCGAGLAAPGTLAGIRAEAWATLLYVPNWHAVLADRDYWELFQKPSPLQHTWSLGIEEQFYLLWPLAIAGLARLTGGRTARWLLWASLGLAVASTAALAWLYDVNDVSRAYYGTDTRAAAILMGCALAAHRVARGPARGGRRSRAWIEAAGLAAVVVLAAAWWRLDGEAPELYRGGLTLCGIAGAALIAAAAHPEPGPLSRALSWAPLRGLGIVSYGVYLWHWPLYLALDEERSGLSGLPLLGLRIAATLAVALASYALLERPIRRGAGSPRAWTVLAPAAAGTVVLAIALATPGARIDPPERHEGSPLLRSFPREPGHTSVLALGDSFVVSLFPGLERAADDYGLELSLGVEIGCRPDHAAPGCPPTWPEQVAALGPDLVLIAQSGFWTLRPIRRGARVLDVGDPRWKQAWLERRQRDVDRLAAAGARRIAFTTLVCFEAWGFRLQPRLGPENTRLANATLAALAQRNPDRVTLLDLGGQACPVEGPDDTPLPLDGLFFDGIHLTPEGAIELGAWLAPRLAAALAPSP